MQREMTPLVVGERTERRRHLSNVALQRIQIGEGRRLTDVLCDPLQRRFRNERADIVQHEAANRRMRLGGEHHADQSAHGRSNPVDLLGARACNQRGQIGHIQRIAVVVLVREPIALSAPDHVRTQHASLCRERLRQKIEVAPVAREAVHADYDARLVGVAPLRVGDSMEPVRAQAMQMARSHSSPITGSGCVASKFGMTGSLPSIRAFSTSWEGMVL